ncbi:DUF6768 family protein [Pleionea sediminis]|uniref:DUF6768 family protein n=1 Tax=Pleionea sediminis TaxID=2569479 RepID=UPI0011866026|nr:DUF6768 family protein [Pleionea sediminis]
MNLDDKIKQALKMDQAEVEQVLLSEKGLLPRVLGVFKGSMKGWNIMGFILAVATAIGMFWCGYYFFVSDNLMEQVFWGFIALAFLTANMATKIWFWMEMNRHSTSREIKRLEVVIAQLVAQLNESK